ncbi:MAG TPA: NADPH-dependent F420 reductase [Acidothermaceae bacterium]|jgi:NADPH-dependent F420 reductase|nr:NADPH-dependent F420 reductase [Acidothermaceae bacterium]
MSESESGAGLGHALDVGDLTVGVLGGTGDQGRGLAYRFGRAGLNVFIGSRDAARAAVAAAEIGAGVRGVGNRECAVGADVVIVAVPWDGHAALLGSLRDALVGKIVVDCVNPLGFDGKGAYALPVAEGSALQQAVALLPQSRVVGAFHHLSAKLLIDVEIESIESDVLVLGDDREATDLVQALAGVVPGMRGVYGGRVRNAHQVEAFTANLVAVNRRYRTHAGVRLTGV